MLRSFNPRGEQITFEDESHTYTFEDGTHPISCTQFIDTFFPHTDFNEKAKQVALKRGVSHGDVLLEWEENKNEAASFGTKIHETAEKIINNQHYTFETKIEEETIHTLKKIIDILQSQMEIIESEKILFSKKYNIAGTTDLLAKVNENTLYILDWKTNKEITTSNKFEQYAIQRGEEHRPYKPISHLPICKKTKYDLQLNLYEFLIREENYFPWAKNIKKSFIHLRENNFKLYNCDNLQKEIKEMLLSSR